MRLLVINVAIIPMDAGVCPRDLLSTAYFTIGQVSHPRDAAMFMSFSRTIETA